MKTKNNQKSKIDWLSWIKLVSEILGLLTAVITLYVYTDTIEKLYFALVVLGSIIMMSLFIVIIVNLLKKIEFSPQSKFRVWLKSLFNKIKWIISGLLFILSFFIFIFPLLFRPNAFIIFDDNLKNYWSIDVLGVRNGVSWNIFDLDSSNIALLITFSNYQANQEIVLTALGSPLKGVDLNKYFRLKGETIRLQVKARSLNNAMSFKVRIGGGNNNSILFQQSRMINLIPTAITEFVIPKEKERAINANESKHVTIAFGIQPAFVTGSKQQILLEKVWFVREGNTLWWKLSIWAALFIIFILTIRRIFKNREIS